MMDRREFLATTAAVTMFPYMETTQKPDIWLSDNVIECQIMRLGVVNSNKRIYHDFSEYFPTTFIRVGYSEKLRLCDAIGWVKSFKKSEDGWISVKLQIISPESNIVNLWKKTPHKYCVRSAGIIEEVEEKNGITHINGFRLSHLMLLPVEQGAIWESDC